MDNILPDTTECSKLKMTVICLASLLAIITLSIFVCGLINGGGGFEAFTSPLQSLQIFKNSGFLAPGPAFFKRPFIRRPLFIRPSLYPLIQDTPEYPSLPYGNCKIIEKVLTGRYRIPAEEVNNMIRLRSQLDTLRSNSWSIAFWARIERGALADKFTIVRKGYAQPSCPQIDYDPNRNIMILTANTVFQQITSNPIDMTGVDITKQNHYAWVQRGDRMTFYVNGIVMMDQRLDSGPEVIIVSRGPLWVISNNIAEYRYFTLCGDAWDAGIVRKVMNDQKSTVLAQI